MLQNLWFSSYVGLTLVSEAVASCQIAAFAIGLSGDEEGITVAGADGRFPNSARVGAGPVAVLALFGRLCCSL